MENEQESLRHQPCAHRRRSPAACHCAGQPRLRLRARTRGADAAKCRRPADDTRQRAVWHPRQPCGNAGRACQRRRIAELHHYRHRMRAALAPLGRQAAPVTDRCRHYGALPCRHVDRKQTLPTRRPVRAPFHPDGNIHQNQNRRADSARQSSRLPCVELCHRRVQREQYFLLAQEHRRVSCRQTAPLPGTDRASYLSRDAGRLPSDSRRRRRNGQRGRFQIPRTEHAEHQVLHLPRRTAGADRSHPQPLCQRQRLVCKERAIRKQRQ